jgi:hypothetical protein
VCQQVPDLPDVVGGEIEGNAAAWPRHRRCSNFARFDPRVPKGHQVPDPIALPHFGVDPLRSVEKFEGRSDLARGSNLTFYRPRHS